jgi:4-amino-4-deoxy-L-arabinose transferase
MGKVPVPTDISSRYFWCALVLPFFFVTLLFGALASWLPSIGGSSEAREAHVIRLMVEHNDYVLPSRNGLIPSKPPLYHWIGAFLSKNLFGFSPFSARLPSLLAAGIVLIVTLSLARLLFRNLLQEQQLIYIVLSGLVLSSSYGFERMRGVAMVDMVFTAAVTLAVAMVLRRLWDQRSAEFSPDLVLRQRDKILFFCFCACAVLAKGPVGLLLSCVIVLPSLLGRLGLRETVKFYLVPNVGWLIFLLLVSPWYYLAALRSQDAFVGKQLVFENIKRFIGGENVNAQPWWFYLPALVSSAFPWSLIFIYSIPRVWRETKAAVQRVSVPQLPITLLTHSLLLCLVFFSISSGKRDSYLLPLLPWLALIVATRMQEYFSSLQLTVTQKFINQASLAVSALVLVTIVAALILEWFAQFGFQFRNEIINMILIWLVRDRAILYLMVAIVLLTMFWGSRSQRLPYQKLFAYGLVVIALMSVFVAAGYSIRNRFKDFDGVAQALLAKVGDQPLQVVRESRDEFFDGILYYLGRSVDLVTPNDFHLRCKGYALVRYDHWQELKGQAILAQAQEVETFFEIDDHLKGKTSNQKILVQCL